MEDTDERLICARNEQKKGQQGDIYSGVLIREEIYEFERQIIWEGKMSVMLPKKFVDMPLELTKKKYPMEQRPQVIKMNEVGDINFTFSILEEPLEKEKVKRITKELEHAIKQAYPANVFYETKVEENEEKCIGWFDFKSHGYDGKIYNLLYLLPVGGKFFQGVFNSPMKEVNVWKPIVLQIIGSINLQVSISQEKEMVQRV